jgi:hypothetical protein
LEKAAPPRRSGGAALLCAAGRKADHRRDLASVKANKIKLPNTISIDRDGRVYLTPHQVTYTLNPKLPRGSFERLVAGEAGRAYLDKVQIRREASPLTVPPRSGILTSCSMYLKEHYVVLNQGEGHFGIHTSAVLLDPLKTFGTNVMLEIYNTGDQPVVNPLVSVEIFRAPPPTDPETKSIARRRTRLLTTVTDIYQCLDENPPRSTVEARPKTTITVRGQSALMENACLLFQAGSPPSLRGKVAEARLDACGFKTIVQALDNAPPDADTLLIDYFPNLFENIELLTRIHEFKLKRIVFRKPSRTHGFFLSSNAHSRLDNFYAIGLDVYWFNTAMGDLYVHTYKKDQGFFIGRNW